jgi:hypothetical protein
MRCIRKGTTNDRRHGDERAIEALLTDGADQFVSSGEWRRAAHVDNANL